MKYLIYPGKFDLPHKGHYQTWKWMLEQSFGKNIKPLISISDKTHDFEPLQKKFLLKQLGIHTRYIVTNNNPYSPKELKFINSNDTVLFIVSKKDKKRFDKLEESSYLQLAKEHKKFNTVKDNSYITFSQTKRFEILGKTINSSTQLKKLYNEIDYKDQIKFIEELYGHYHKVTHDILNDRILNK